ncbi:MAG: hypothetical protein Q8M98_06265 [Candidatus Cloacimonadaceae bacterium]|nr:hypothetical protein [Candidatus Cloacimonadaceae bacterium]
MENAAGIIEIHGRIGDFFRGGKYLRITTLSRLLIGVLMLRFDWLERFNVFPAKGAKLSLCRYRFTAIDAKACDIYLPRWRRRAILMAGLSW